MWRPPDRIKHRLPDPEWPTAEQAAGSRLFSPLRLPAGLELKQRTWIPAMVPWRATADGQVTPELLEWYGRFADGQPGAIVVEATGIRDIPSGPLLRIGHPRFVEGLRELTRVVKQRSAGQTRVFIQLIDFLRIRRRPDRERFLRRFLQLTADQRARLAALRPGLDERDALVALPDPELESVLGPRDWEALQYGARERITDLHLPHIRELPAVLPGLFASAAGRAIEAGFDGIELHYAHAYTMSSFMSALNTRDDEYGGSLAGRVRLPLEVVQAVRAEVGTGVPVGCRMLCHDIVAGGSDVADASSMAVELARAGMDFISLSTGGRFEDARQPKVGEAAYPYTGPSGYECMPSVQSDAAGPFGRQLGRQSQVRAAIRTAGLSTPVVVAGGIGTFAMAEAALQDGAGDVIAAARQSLADPDWFLKMRRGLGGQVRRCKYTNYCEALDQKHAQVTCQLWDRTQLDEPGLRRSHDGKRRLSAPGWDFPDPVTNS